MNIKQVDGPFGAEVGDIDLRRITAGQVAAIDAARRQHGVVFIRDQRLTCEEHIAFAEQCGEIVVNRFFETVPDYPQIAMVRKEPSHTMTVGQDWHTDHSYDRAPAMGSILYAKEVPASGGDTEFASMYMAYQGLSDELKETLAGLTARHSSRHAFGADSPLAHDPTEDRFKDHHRAVQDSVHPVVITHPESGKKALFVNPDFTVQLVGISDQESQALLQSLYRHAVRPEFVYRFRWNAGDIAFWDNRATWHRAPNDYPNQRRVMHRITLKGCDIH